MTETQTQNPQTRLQEIIATMDVPELRRTDIWWLSRNLTIGNRNHNHPQLAEALNLLKQIRKTERMAAMPNEKS
jgi:hypothetical protein